MKHLKIPLFIIILLQIFYVYTSTQTNNVWPPISGPVSETHKNLLNATNSYPRMAVIEQDDSEENETISSVINNIPIDQIQQNNSTNQSSKKYIAQQIIKERGQNPIPPKVNHVMATGSLGFLHGKNGSYHNYPKGDALFKNYPTLSVKFNKLIDMLIKNPWFIPFFRKIHLNILNELYKYLMNIYTNFNLQHVGIQEVTNAQGESSLNIDIPLFLQHEKEYDQNKKTLIINHLINVIESQMNGAVRSVMPNVPHLYATYTGKTLIQNDYSIDLTHFIVKQVTSDMKSRKQKYLQALATYIDFFKEYTSLLHKPYQGKSQHYTAFLDIAETINQYLYGATTITGNETAEEKMKQILNKMDPPMFTFNYDDIRAIKIIPHLAKTLNPKSEKITWPNHIIEAANEGIMVNDKPIAYFMNASGEVVREPEASKLFIILQSGKNFFQEELLEQPDWLNSWDGIANILEGCFGNFSSLIGLDILDPCMEALVENAIETLDGNDPNEQNSSYNNICQNLINEWNNQKPTQVLSLTKSSTDSQKLQNYLEQNLPQTSNSISTTLPMNLTSNTSPSLIPSLDNISNLTPSTSDISLALNQ